MKEHRLKTWPEFYVPLAAGLKTAEIRFNDRDFSIGDRLYLEEWEPSTKTFTGNLQIRHISHILRDHPGLTPGYALLSFREE